MCSINKRLTIAALACAVISASVFAESPKYRVGAIFENKQLARGQVRLKDPILSFVGGFNYAGFDLGALAICDVTNQGADFKQYGDRKWKYQELTFTPSYRYRFGEVEVGGSYAYEYHPHVDEEKYLRDTNPNTQMLRVWTALPEVFLAPELSAKLDVEREHGAVYYRFAISRPLRLWASGDEARSLSLLLGAYVGAGNNRRRVIDRGEDSFGMMDYATSAALIWRPSQHLSVVASALATDLLSEKLRESARNKDPRGKHAQLVGALSVIANF